MDWQLGDKKAKRYEFLKQQISDLQMLQGMILAEEWKNECRH